METLPRLGPTVGKKDSRSIDEAKDNFRDTSMTRPSKRSSHESALVDNHLYLFGGTNGRKFFPRNEIWVMNLGVEPSKRKWVRRLAQGQIPPPCKGARCVVINKMIYSYGGRMKDGTLLGIIYCLVPKNMKWIKVDTFIEGKKPVPRTECSLCVIGSRIVMFGGYVFQSWADNYGWNNEIYISAVDIEGRGVCSDLKLSGRRPERLRYPAMISIDGNQAILFGTDIQQHQHSFVLNLQNESWTSIDFELSPRGGHVICQLVKEGLEEKSRLLLIGGLMVSSSLSVYVSNIDDPTVYKMEVGEEFKIIYFYASHCVQNEDKTTGLLVYNEGLKVLHFDLKNEFFMKIEPQLRLSMIDYFQRKCTQLEKEATCSRREFDQKQAEDHRRFENERISIMQVLASKEADLNLCKNIEIPTLRQNLEKEVSAFQRQLQQRDDEISFLRRKLVNCEEELAKAQHNLDQRNDETSAQRQELDQKAQDLLSCEKKAAEAQHFLKEREDEISNLNEKLSTFRRELGKAQRHLHDRDEKISTLTQDLSFSQDEYDANTLTIRQELDDAQRSLQNKNEVISTLRQNLLSSQGEYDANALTMRQGLDDAQRSLETKNEEISTLRDKLERLEVERSHVSTKTERPANEDETNTSINRSFLNVNLYHVLLLLGIGAICFGVYLNMHVSSPSSSSLLFLYTADWNAFSRAVCNSEFGFRWQYIGDQLGYDSHSLQEIHETGQGCQSLFAKYIKENGDSKETRSKVLNACLAIQTGSQLEDTVKWNDSGSVYDAPWNTFARLVSETCFPKLMKIGDQLNFEWIDLQGLDEHGEKAKTNLRSIVEQYKQKMGDSKKVRKKIIGACRAVELGGLLNDSLSKEGYTL